jgi:hypothetical protein
MTRATISSSSSSLGALTASNVYTTLPNSIY